MKIKDEFSIRKDIDWNIHVPLRMNHSNIYEGHYYLLSIYIYTRTHQVRHNIQMSDV